MSDKFQWDDEVIQFMYWMKGENLAQEVTDRQIGRFLQLDEGQLDESLQRLVRLGWIRLSSSSADARSYLLTSRGLEEGKRRFAEEFSSYLGQETHGQCSDPECACHTPGWEGLCPSVEQRAGPKDQT